MQLLTNQIGYETSGTKHAVLCISEASAESSKAELVRVDSDEVVASFDVGQPTQVARWHQGLFCEIDFSEFAVEGRYVLRVNELQSSPFDICEGVLMNTTFSDVLHYFKSQRCGGIYEKQDRTIPLLNSDKTVDVRGGWYDASGDVSKYLSHLSYANFLNPQQTPMVVWNMLKGLELVEERSDFAAYSRVRLTEEALFGADFLARMQHPEGFFYMTVFDKWSKDVKQREICAYATQDGHKSDDYQAGFRQGGGIAIAALAAASRLDVCGEFSQEQYLQAAEKGYWHLKEYNTQYLNDGEENIIDEYCALLACVELYRSTGEQCYLSEGQMWANRLSLRQLSDARFEHFWAATDDGSRPYYHAAEAGLPVIALCEYLAVERRESQKSKIRAVVNKAVSFELTITHDTANPFGYPRQYVKSVNGEKRDAFFVAHDNETGYWWQGENARLGSLASMIYLAKPYLDESLLPKAEQYAQRCLDWIVGLNPYDMCMLDGHGKNNPDYLPQYGFFNAKGGVCNGITGGFEDEEDIAFNPTGQKDDMMQNWRWGEQWIPHGAWFLLATMSQFTTQTQDKIQTQDTNQ
ncbi:glycoside hydrolase family 9 protein [Vibrio nigripulchritudo]|uniref:glycoside hydrolase family 9 protein n=1 Tax=Vibrio nigripulchritudo TaxID=28173 RepID=UPI0003B225A9|nr:glycoside hydrolase family 9 protein [Vibrio nigripulchritudo]CCN69050.1 putative glycosidase [Vibrio nigripulchritudo SFn118]